MKKIAIVTGASSGMGACFALQLAKESAAFRKADRNSMQAADEIWLIARREDRLMQVKQQIEHDSLTYSVSGSCAGEAGRQLYPAVRPVALDISGKAGALAVKQLLDEESSRTQQDGGFIITVLVNNAGFGSYGEFANTDIVREMDMIDLDCTSLTGITGFALPYLTRGSRIINTASLASFLPLGNFAVYGACKSYVLSFTVALAAELHDKGIKVTALCPGPVSTEFADVASKGARKKVRHGLSPEKTVEHCLRQSRKGKLYALWAFKWKFKAAASRFIGRYAGAWFTYKFCKRPSN